jgi:hypothetical protein
MCHIVSFSSDHCPLCMQPISWQRKLRQRAGGCVVLTSGVALGGALPVGDVECNGDQTRYCTYTYYLTCGGSGDLDDYHGSVHHVFGMHSHVTYMMAPKFFKGSV